MHRPISASLATALLSPALGWAACDFNSGPKTTALVELYTSEGSASRLLTTLTRVGQS